MSRARPVWGPGSWRDWSAYLAGLPADANEPERARWRAAYEVAAGLLPDTDPMWLFHPHDWTPRDIEIRCRDFTRTLTLRSTTPMLTPKPMSDTDVVTINPGPLGWPGEAAAYMRACPFTRQGYDVVDVAMDAMRLHGWRLNGFWHRDWTLNDWRTFAGLFGTDHAIPMDNGYAAACSYSIRACIAAWEKGYTIRSYYRREDYPPPAAS